MQGLLTSSTRAELRAVLSGLLAPGPVHLGSDNKGGVQKGSKIIMALRAGNQVDRVRLLLGKDGDLWALFHDMVLKRSPFAVMLHWVKGHATAEQVARQESGRSTAGATTRQTLRQRVEPSMRGRLRCSSSTG